MQIIEAESIADVLNYELSRRIQKNPEYSMRAFARDLHLSPSRMCEVLKGSTGLTEVSLDFIVKQVTKKSREQNYLRELVRSHFSRSPRLRELARERALQIKKTETHRRLRNDEFEFVSQWYHAAILELMQLQDFKSDVKWISDRLGVKKSLITPALERLQNLKLIFLNETGQWQAVPEPSLVMSDVPSLAIRKAHQQILAMHMESLREDPMEVREHLSTVLAIPRARLKELQEDLRKFQFQFWQKIADDPKDDLYSFSIQFCPVRNRYPQRESNE